jgi:putative PEP-CTERM system TPR-repeat lipoprotein
MNATFMRKMACSAALAVVFGFTGCQRHDAASYLGSAKAHLEKGDYKAALIETKNALQKEPDNPEARLMLARLLLSGGDAQGAETEVRKALDVHAPEDEAYPLLGQAMLARGEHANVVKELSSRKLGTPEARSKLSMALAGAYAMERDRAAAEREADAALRELPGNADALLFKAQLAAGSGDIAGAEKYIDLTLKEAPKSASALLMKAQLAMAQNRPDDAQALMQQAVDGNPEAVEPRAALVSFAVATGKQDLAKTNVEKLKEFAPRDVRTLYSDALVAYMEGDNAHARDTTQRVLAVRPDDLPSLLLSGLADLRLGTYASAEDKLRRVVQRAPGDGMARRGLALAYLRSGRPGEALDTLQSALARAPNDPTLLRLTGEAYLGVGKPAQAAAAYEQANSVDKGNVASGVRLAQVRLATGDAARGFDELESLAAKDDSGQAELALFSAHLKRREYDKALADADAFAKRQPKSAVPYNLRGAVYLAKRDLVKARESFEKALEVQPDYYPAASNLATLDIQEGKVQAAQDRYRRLLEKYPKNEQALIASAQLLVLTGAPADQVRSALDKAVQANPTSVAARVARIRYELSGNDPKAALSAAQAAIAAIPKNPQIIDLLASAHLKDNDANQAVDTLKQLVVLQPQNPLVLLRLAELQTAVKSYDAAIENERKALAMKPDLAQAWVALARTYAAAGKPDSALAEARRLQKERPDKSLGYALEGEIHVAQKRWPEAASAFRAALSRQPAPILAARLYVTLLVAGKADEARAMATRWNKEHPDDATLLEVMAEQDQRRKDYAAAVEGYKRVLAVDDDNVAALNNLAWILTEQGNPQAVQYAEQAHRASPLNPNVLDTLGWSLTKTGDPKRGVQLLRMASALAPANNEIRLHLGKALVASGDKAGAKQALADLVKLDKDSPLRVEAEKTLSGG